MSRENPKRTILSDIMYLKKKGFETNDVIRSGWGEGKVVHAAIGAVRDTVTGILITNLYRFNWKKIR